MALLVDLCTSDHTGLLMPAGSIDWLGRLNCLPSQRAKHLTFRSRIVGFALTDGPNLVKISVELFDNLLFAFQIET